MLAVTLPKEYEEQLLQQLLVLARKAVGIVIEEQEEKKNKNERWLNQTEVIKYYSTNYEQIQKWRSLGLKRVRVGGSYRYDIYEIDALLESLKE